MVYYHSHITTKNITFIQCNVRTNKWKAIKKNSNSNAKNVQICTVKRQEEQLRPTNYIPKKNIQQHKECDCNLLQSFIICFGYQDNFGSKISIITYKNKFKTMLIRK